MLKPTVSVKGARQFLISILTYQQLTVWTLTHLSSKQPNNQPWEQLAYDKSQPTYSLKEPIWRFLIFTQIKCWH